MRVEKLYSVSVIRLALAAVFSSLVLLSGCPLSGGGAAPPSSSGAAAGDSPCHRSLDGDIKTATDRLSRGHSEEALVYIQAIRGCPENIESLEFLELASAVYEELGDLNEAWWALHAAGGIEGGTAEEVARLSSRRDSFEGSYSRLASFGPDGTVIDINYKGAILDDATFELLRKVSSNAGVDLGSGLWGFWLFPGRYEIMGKSHTLLAGQTLDLNDRSKR